MKNWFLFLLLAAGHAYGFQNTLQKSAVQEQTYYQDVMPVKVHLTFSQDDYVAGDTVFFKAIVRPNGDLAPSNIRTILHVVLKTADGKTIQQQTVRVENGEAANQLLLNSSLPSGKYLLTAYNDWMEKYDPSLFFQKTIWVGEEKREGVQSVAAGVYPEGGNLVAGLNQKIVVKGPANTSAVIRNNASEIVAQLQLDQFGLGVFSLTPSADQKYLAYINGDSKPVAFPEVQKDGFAVSVTERGNGDVMRVRIQLPESSSLRNKEVLYMATSQGKSFYAGRFQMKDQSSVDAEIPLTNAPAGVCSFSLFVDNEIVAERLFYVAEKAQIKPAVTLSADEFSTRQKVEAKIKLPETKSGSKMAVTVFRKSNGATRSDDKTIENSLQFYSAVSGTSANPSNLFSGSSDSLSSADQFLMTQQWKRPLREAPDKKQQYFSSRIHVTGKAIRANGQLVPDSAKITFLLQKSVSIYYAYVKNSRFDVAMWMDFFGEEDIFYRVVYQNQILEDVRLVADPYPGQTLATATKADDASTFSGKRRLINKSFEYYLASSANIKSAELNKEFENEIFSPDIKVNLADYLIFPTIEETLREIVPFVQHRKIKGKDAVRVVRRVGEYKIVAEEKPLIVIDGVVTDDSDLFLRMKPADILTIKVINRSEKLDMFGDLGKGGIILVETKLPDFAVSMPKPETIIKAIGHSETLLFHSARYSASNLRTPELRTNLFWSPNVVTDEKGEAAISFYTNDIIGDFIVRVEGITTEGKPFHTEETFKVTFRRP